MATVTYNGSQPWGSNNPPYVNVSHEPVKYGEKWANVTKISIVGYASENLVGNLETFKDSVKTTFSVNDKTFVVDGKSFSNCFVDSISFPVQRFFGKLDYTINLTSYDFDAVSINSTSLKVLDPTELIQTSEESNNAKVISHTVSARGRDGASGFSDARTWVNARLSSYTPSGGILMEETENLDRTKSIYSINRRYKIDSNASGTSTFRRYSISITENLNSEYKTVEISAEYIGGKDTSFSTLRGALDTVSSLKTLAQDKSGITLNSKPVSQSIQEDENNKKITFNCSFDDNTLFSSGDSFFDYSVSLNEDHVTGVTTISIDGELITRGSKSERVALINSFISGTTLNTYLHGLCNTTYSDILSSPYTLNTEPENISISKNEEKATLKLTASFNDEDKITNFSDANWEVTVNPSIPYIKSAASATQNGYYSQQNFGFLTRESVSTNVSVTAAENSSSTPTTSLVEGQLSSIETSLHAAFTGSGSPYNVSQGKSEQSEENLGGSQQLTKSYDEGTQLIIM